MIKIILPQLPFPKNRSALILLGAITFMLCSCTKPDPTSALNTLENKPNIILIMTDDQGYAQTGYYGHPVLKTPNLDAMAANGLRLDRFYAGAPVCSPTRASVLTGRSNDRTGVLNHGHALHRQEKTLPAALLAAGYTTGHFGKWHLDALRGPGIPIFKNDTHHPGVFGFEEWLSVTNFFDLNPIMSHNGEIVEFKGDTSSIIVEAALTFIRQSIDENKPFFAVIWDGSPHDPFVASEADREAFSDLDEASQHHYGELVAFDRSVGTLRESLRELEVAENTLIWYCSDNGGLQNVTPSSVGNLRDFKGSVYEGGLRVPAIIEWPGRIQSRISNYPASTMDIFPTLADILDLPVTAMLEPVDGISLVRLFEADLPSRIKPIPFKRQNTGAYLDNNYKLVSPDLENRIFELYDLATDPSESRNLALKQPEIFTNLLDQFDQWLDSVETSVAGQDYPEGRVREDEPKSVLWMTDPRFAPYLEEWSKRPEYAERIRRSR